MFSLMLSILLIVVQAVFCNSLGCRMAGPVEQAPAARHVHHIVDDASGIGDTLADLGHAAIALAFSGVVEVGQGPAAARSLRALDC